MDIPQWLSIMERLQMAEARLQVAAEVAAGPNGDLATLHDELETVADELNDVVADLFPDT